MLKKHSRKRNHQPKSQMTLSQDLNNVSQDLSFLVSLQMIILMVTPIRSSIRQDAVQEKETDQRSTKMKHTKRKEGRCQCDTAVGRVCFLIGYSVGTSIPADRRSLDDHFSFSSSHLLSTLSPFKDGFRLLNVTSALDPAEA